MAISVKRPKSIEPIERVQMPRRYDGKRVADRWLCAKGHLHPSRAHAVKCQQRTRLESP